MATQATYVTSARVTLDDPNPPATLFTDVQLQAHVQHAVSEYSLWNPLEVKESGFVLTAGSRDVDISSIATKLFSVLAVEYPTGQFPITYVQFQRYANVLTVQLDGAPIATDPLALNLYTLEKHTVDNSGSTIPWQHDEVIIAGAVHFAALELSFRTAGLVNIAGPQVWLRYRDLAVDKGNEFRGYLQTVRARITPNRLYHADEPRQSRFAVEAPWRD